MPFNLKGRSFLTLLDFSPDEIQFLIDLAADLKAAKYNGTEVPRLQGKTVCLLFQKDSTRTRCAFEIGATDQGMHTVYLGPSGSQFGKKESVADSARVLGRMFDGIQFRGFSQKVCQELAEHANVPVWNGLTDLYHPTQVLADFLTILEQKKTLKKLRFGYFGDGRNNVANSLMIGATKMGMDFVLVSPRSLWPNDSLVNQCEAFAAQSGGSLTITDHVLEGAKNLDVIYTDVWVSMGEPESVWEERINLLKPYQVSMEVVRKAKDDVIFLHCLPAFHNTKTEVGKQIASKFGITEMEVSDEVFESKHSRVFQEAENRLHTIKALMVATIGN